MPLCHWPQTKEREKKEIFVHSSLETDSDEIPLDSRVLNWFRLAARGSLFGERARVTCVYKTKDVARVSIIR